MVLLVVSTGLEPGTFFRRAQSWNVLRRDVYSWAACISSAFKLSTLWACSSVKTQVALHIAQPPGGCSFKVSVSCFAILDSFCLIDEGSVRPSSLSNPDCPSHVLATDNLSLATHCSRMLCTCLVPVVCLLYAWLAPALRLRAYLRYSLGTLLLICCNFRLPACVSPPRR